MVTITWSKKRKKKESYLYCLLLDNSQSNSCKMIVKSLCKCSGDLPRRPKRARIVCMFLKAVWRRRVGQDIVLMKVVLLVRSFELSFSSDEDLRKGKGDNCDLTCFTDLATEERFG